MFINCIFCHTRYRKNKHDSRKAQQQPNDKMVKVEVDDNGDYENGGDIDPDELSSA